MTSRNNIWSKLLIVASALIANEVYAQQIIWKVDHESTDSSPDGLTWLSAFPNLQDALELAAAGDQVLVANGVYLPSDGLDNPPPDPREATFRLPNDVEMYGGFQGISHPDGPDTEGDSSDANWIANETILDGDIGIPDDHNDNSYHVVTATEVSPATRLDGFTVRHGRAIHPEELGGGLLTEDASPLIVNCTFVNNTGGGGGAIFIDGKYSLARTGPRCISCTFTSNISGNRGGAAWVRDAEASFHNCLFHGNLAAKGGALFSEAGLIVRNCTIALNHATSGGTSDVGGGGIALDSGSVNVARGYP